LQRWSNGQEGTCSDSRLFDFRLSGFRVGLGKDIKPCGATLESGGKGARSHPGYSQCRWGGVSPANLFGVCSGGARERLTCYVEGAGVTAKSTVVVRTTVVLELSVPLTVIM
jgi:hypothetical protein